RRPLDIGERLGTESAAGHAEAFERSDARAASSGEKVLALGGKAAARGAAALGLQAAQALQAGVGWGGDRRQRCLWCGSGNKKGAVLVRSDAREAVSCLLPVLLRPPTPRG